MYFHFIQEMIGLSFLCISHKGYMHMYLRWSYLPVDTKYGLCVLQRPIHQWKGR